MLNFCVGYATRAKELVLVASDSKKVTTGDLMKINPRSAGDHTSTTAFERLTYIAL